MTYMRETTYNLPASVIAARQNPPDFTQAECRNSNPTLFYPEQGVTSDALAAKRVCQKCPIINECLQYAIEAQEYGIWGGATLLERRMISKQKNRNIKTMVSL